MGSGLSAFPSLSGLNGTTTNTGSNSSFPYTTATLGTDGQTVTIVFPQSENVGSRPGRFTVSSAIVSGDIISYVSGSPGTTLVYKQSIGVLALQGDSTVTLSWANHGSSGDMTPSLPNFTNGPVVNNSTVLNFLVSATVSTSGTQLTTVWGTNTTGTTSDGLTLTTSSGIPSLTYVSGSGTTTLIHTIGTTVYSGDTPTLAYSGTGLTPSPSSFSGTSVTNNSTQNPPAPTVTSITNGSITISGGFPAGGSTVTINGTNLSSASSVKFGSTSATILSNTSTVITATDPGGTSGTTVDITVVTAGGTSATSSSDKYFWLTTPTAYWKLNESSSTRVDQMSNPCNLSVTGTINQTAGLITNAASPGTAASRLSNSSLPGKMSPGSGAWTITSWFYPTTNPSLSEAILTFGNTFNGFNLTYTGSNYEGQIFQSNQSQQSLTTTDGIALNTWHLVMLNFDGSHLNLQIDNGTIHQVAASASTAFTSVYLSGGLSVNGTNASATGDSMCENAYWVGHTLSSNESTILYNSRTGHTCNGTNWL